MELSIGKIQALKGYGVIRDVNNNAVLGGDLVKASNNKRYRLIRHKGGWRWFCIEEKRQEVIDLDTLTRFTLVPERKKR